MKRIPRIFEKTYPLSKKFEKILEVMGKKDKPINKKIDHHFKIKKISELGIIPLQF